MDDSGIWTMVIIISVVVLIVTFLTSVTAWHKKFVEKPLEKMEEKANEVLADKGHTNKETPYMETTNEDTTNNDTKVKNPEDINVKNPEGV